MRFSVCVFIVSLQEDAYRVLCLVEYTQKWMVFTTEYLYRLGCQI